jgi:hypothetical protein
MASISVNLARNTGGGINHASILHRKTQVFHFLCRYTTQIIVRKYLFLLFAPFQLNSQQKKVIGYKIHILQGNLSPLAPLQVMPVMLSYVLDIFAEHL